jgi:hypothetical protein
MLRFLNISNNKLTIEFQANILNQCFNENSFNDEDIYVKDSGEEFINLLFKILFKFTNQSTEYTEIFFDLSFSILNCIYGLFIISPQLRTKYIYMIPFIHKLFSTI